VLADLVFIALRVVHNQTSLLPSAAFKVQADGGYAEWWQYVKYGLILAMAAALLAWKRDAIYVLWCTLAGYLLFDDAFRFHEQVGARIADILPFESIAGLRGQDVGVRGAVLLEEGGEMLVISGMLVMVFDRFYVKLGRRRQAAALPEQRGYAFAPSAETSASSTRAR